MASLRDIRKHISSVRNIRQITYAMKMVAAARIKRAQGSILASRPFASRMETMLKDLYGELGEEDFRTSPAYPLFEQRKDHGPIGLCVVTADKGLCGSFNNNILKASLAWLARHRGRKVRLALVGRKSRDFFHRLRGLDLDIEMELTGIFPKASCAHAELLAGKMLDSYAACSVCGYTVVYNEFKSMMSQRVVEAQLLPLSRHILLDPSCGPLCHNFAFEPGKAEFLGALLPRYVKAQVYRILLESQAAELAARMSAMESASNNASDLISDLTLKLNKMRQAMITTELNEIVGGAEALGG